MRKFLSLIMFLTTLFAAKGQNIKNERIEVKYMQLPYTPLKKELKSYRKTIELMSLTMEDSRESLNRTIGSSLELKGNEFQEVQSNADLETYARLEGYAVDRNSVDSEERSETKSDKTTVKYRVYFGTCYIVYPLFVRLRDIKDDKTLYEGYINGSDRYVMQRTGEYRDYDAAKGALRTLVSEGKSKLLNQNVSSLSQKMINDYSFYPTSLRWSINYVETSKKANYDDVVAAKDATMTALATLSNTTVEITPESKQAVLGAIEKWQTILKESNIEDRKARIDRKVTQAIQENIAFCYYFLHNFSEAEKITQASKETNKQQWQFDLLQSIADSKKRFEANQAAFE
jgi:hypothetical protein